jgi:hypothetical protein
MSVDALAALLGQPKQRVVGAILGLSADGLVKAEPSALAGRPDGRVRLPR